MAREPKKSGSFRWGRRKAAPPPGGVPESCFFRAPPKNIPPALRPRPGAEGDPPQAKFGVGRLWGKRLSGSFALGFGLGEALREAPRTAAGAGNFLTRCSVGSSRPLGSSQRKKTLCSPTHPRHRLCPWGPGRSGPGRNSVEGVVVVNP